MIWVMNREGQWVQTPAASFDDIEEKIDVPVTLPRYCLTERVASDTAYVDSSDEAARGPSESADADCCDANVCGLSAGSTAQALPDDDANLECGAAAAFACFHPTPTEDDYESGEPVFLKVYQFVELDSWHWTDQIGFGIYHSAVQVRDVEFSFSRNGIIAQKPSDYENEGTSGTGATSRSRAPNSECTLCLSGFRLRVGARDLSRHDPSPALKVPSLAEADGRRRFRIRKLQHADAQLQLVQQRVDIQTDGQPCTGMAQSRGAFRCPHRYSRRTSRNPPRESPGGSTDRSSLRRAGSERMESRVQVGVVKTEVKFGHLGL